jgi:SAM-dependent methyltransferase
MNALQARHLSALTFPEVSRALRALSSIYVERRSKITEGGALSGAGKRAAFALFYGPLHYLLVRQIVAALPGATRPLSTIIDLGCGTGAAGAAWAAACHPPAAVIGIDRHPWVLEEAARTYREFHLRGRTERSDITAARISGRRSAVLAAFTMNELPEAGRDALLARLVDRARCGHRLLIVEPLAASAARWWDAWRVKFEAEGGRTDEWRFKLELPTIVAKLDSAAGLDHGVLTGRTFWLPGRDRRDR